MPSASHPTPDEPVPARLLALADRCVQCGLCLPACPTYGLDRTEAESPRGRIALARAWELGTAAPTAIADQHLDHCLGCRSCEAVCPAGVAFGELLVEARSRQSTRRGRPWRQAAIEWLTARPRLLHSVFALYRRLFPLLPAVLRPLPRPPAGGAASGPGLDSPAAPAVALFVGCVASPYEIPLRNAVERLCAASGTRVQNVAAQVCCGALHSHGGNTVMASQLAATNRAAFSEASTVLTLASGCHEAVSQALAGATTIDSIAYLHQRIDRLRFMPHRERVALHLPCTQRNVVKSVSALRALLARVPELEVIELTAGYGCCGAAGTHMLTEPARAAAYRQPLVDAFERSGATRLLSANIGCRLHFANAMSSPVQHPLEFLASCVS